MRASARSGRAPGPLRAWSRPTIRELERHRRVGLNVVLVGRALHVCVTCTHPQRFDTREGAGQLRGRRQRLRRRRSLLIEHPRHRVVTVPPVRPGRDLLAATGVVRSSCRRPSARRWCELDTQYARSWRMPYCGASRNRAVVKRTRVGARSRVRSSCTRPPCASRPWRPNVRCSAAGGRRTSVQVVACGTPRSSPPRSRRARARRPPA